MNKRMCPCHLWKWKVSERCWKQQSTDLRGLAAGYCRRCGARLNDDGTCGLRARDIDIAFHGHKRALEIMTRAFHVATQIISDEADTGLEKLRGELLEQAEEETPDAPDK